MKNFVGYPLETVEAQLKSQGIEYKVVENSFKVEGDRVLVTNVKSQDNLLVLTVGKFIFDIEGKHHEEHTNNK